jgi:NADH-quinone oxidoreductase subunit L
VFPAGVQAHRGCTVVSALTIAAPVAGLAIAVLFYLTGTFSAQKLVSSEWARGLQRYWFSGWGLDSLYNALLIRPFKAIAGLNRHDVVDRGYTAMAKRSFYLHYMASAVQTGRLRWYAASMGLGTVLIIAIGLLS